jgi:ribose/xylose/arabinose/galactoside ABC-type transport system permease subunit
VVQPLELEKKKRISIPDTAILFLVLIALFILFSFTSQNFFTYANISTMLNNMVIAGIIAIGITPLIVARGLDISFGASLSLSTVIMAIQHERGLSLWLCLLIGFILPIFVGLFNGLLAEYFNLIPLILTLATTSILIALGQVLTNGRSILMLTDELFYFATKSLFIIPYPVIVLLLILLIYWFFLSFTKVGKQIYFIGANPQAAKLSGIRVKFIKIMLYVTMGAVTGIASIIMVALSGIGYIYHGNNLLLPVLSAVFLGGMSLRGGEGSIWKTIIGITIITIIFTGLSLMNIQFYFIQIFQGFALVIIVAFYEIRKNRSIAK